MVLLCVQREQERLKGNVLLQPRGVCCVAAQLITALGREGVFLGTRTSHREEIRVAKGTLGQIIGASNANTSVITG